MLSSNHSFEPPTGLRACGGTDHVGDGQVDSQLKMARPTLRGQVTKDSKQALASAMNPATASKGCKIIQKKEAIMATGQVMNQSSISQSKAKQQFLMMQSDSSKEELQLIYSRHHRQLVDWARINSRITADEWAFFYAGPREFCAHS
jgi:hypothetical protein